MIESEYRILPRDSSNEFFVGAFYLRVRSLKQPAPPLAKNPLQLPIESSTDIKWTTLRVFRKLGIPEKTERFETAGSGRRKS
jgi:hypothetical protein